MNRKGEYQHKPRWIFPETNRLLYERIRVFYQNFHFFLGRTGFSLKITKHITNREDDTQHRSMNFSWDEQVFYMKKAEYFIKTSIFPGTNRFFPEELKTNNE